MARFEATLVTAIAVTLAVAGTAGCASAPGSPERPPPIRPGDPLPRTGDEVIVAGQLFHTGTGVVTWLDAGGYDAAAPRRHDLPDEVLPSKPAGGCDTPSRLSAGRTLAPEAAAVLLGAAPPGAEIPEGPVVGVGPDVDLAVLREQITQFVVHYDVAFTSANCFHVLHDVRGLSVHFLLDLDGTLYQTCDLRERARHAGAANDRSVGIEIAHPGARGPDGEQPYERDPDGRVRLRLPDGLRRGALAEGFVARPARDEPIAGRIQGGELLQWDFTEAQYRSLAHLLATLSRVFPRLRLEAPREPDGAVTPRALGAAKLAAFEGVIGHYHVTTNKSDPGPAFDWDRVLEEARALVGGAEVRASPP